MLTKFKDWAFAHGIRIYRTKNPMTSPNISVDENYYIYSYRTKIGRITFDPSRVVTLTTVKYSPTTSRQINSLDKLFRENDFVIEYREFYEAE